jgi:hypothetical protein
MLGGYDTNGLAADWREARRFGHEATIDATGAGEAAELRDRALRLLAVGVGDHTPIEVQEQVAEIARRLAQLEPPAQRWG